MEKIVGITFLDKKHGQGALITWGNLFQDETLLFHVERCLGRRFGVELDERMEYASSLTCIADEPYFYESLIRFIQEPVPSSIIKYNRWLKAKRKAIKNRKDIYITGFKSRYCNYLERKAQGFLDNED